MTPPVSRNLTEDDLRSGDGPNFPPGASVPPEDGKASAARGVAPSAAEAPKSEAASINVQSTASILFVGALFLAVLLGRWALLPSAESVPVQPSLILDLNIASKAQLEALPGVGPSLATRIVEWRTKHGVFRDLAELKEIDGVGDATLENLSQWLLIVDVTPADSEQ